MHYKNKIIMTALLAFIFSGCGNDNGSQPSAALQQDIIKGLVSDRDGIIGEGQVIISTVDGARVATAAVTANGEFKAVVPAGAAYPLLLSVQADDGLLEAVVMSALAEKQDITDMSTLVVQSARDLGGINKENMARAAMNAIRQNKKSGGSKTSTGFKGDPTKQYGGWH